MKHLRRIIAMLLVFILLIPAALAASTPTPPPVEINTSPVTPPESIQKVLDIAYTEWETLAGKTLKRTNKYTEWRGKGVSFGWCAGYVTWCMIEAGIEMYEKEHFLETDNDTEEGFYPAEGVIHVKEAGVGNLLQGYQRMNRTTMVPQPGFILVYGCSYNRTIHVGLVYDVIDLGGGKYRITTLEGNMSNRVKMYIRDYDMNVEIDTNNRKSTNLSEIPEADRTLPESDHVDYDVVSAKPSSSASSKYMYYVHCFLMPWVPGDEPAPTATPTAEPTAEPTPEPNAEPTPQPTEAPAADVTAAPEATEIPAEATAAPAPAPTDAPAGDVYPCQGKGGTCPYITRSAEDTLCRDCDWNNDGIED